jgi:hypothetical protein
MTCVARTPSPPDQVQGQLQHRVADGVLPLDRLQTHDRIIGIRRHDVHANHRTAPQDVVEDACVRKTLSEPHRRELQVEKFEETDAESVPATTISMGMFFTTYLRAATASRRWRRVDGVAAA